MAKECNNCGGDGIAECPECDRGLIDCEVCNGDGEINGVECEDCDWGVVDCDYCDASSYPGLGMGKVKCESCKLGQDMGY